MTWGKLAAGVESQPQKGMSDMTTETHVQITEAEVAEERSRTTTKKEMVDRIAASTQQSRSDVKRTIQAFLDEVIEELGRGNRLEFRDFGVFEIRERAPRQAQNPKTLERVDVPARRTVKFKTGRLMKNKVEGTEV